MCAGYCVTKYTYQYNSSSLILRRSCDGEWGCCCCTDTYIWSHSIRHTSYACSKQSVNHTWHVLSTAVCFFNWRTIRMKPHESAWSAPKRLETTNLRKTNKLKLPYDTKPEMEWYKTRNRANHTMYSSNYIPAGSSIYPQISPAMNAACNSNSGAPRHVCTKFNANTRKADCVGPILSHI